MKILFIVDNGGKVGNGVYIYIVHSFSSLHPVSVSVSPSTPALLITQHSTIQHVANWKHKLLPFRQQYYFRYLPLPFSLIFIFSPLSLHSCFFFQEQELAMISIGISANTEVSNVSSFTETKRHFLISAFVFSFTIYTSHLSDFFYLQEWPTRFCLCSLQAAKPGTKGSR